MTNLTKESRISTINSVIQKGTTLPAQKEDLKLRLQQRVRAICLERVPAEFGPATKNLPAEWFQHKASAGIYQEVNPYSIVTKSVEHVERHRCWADSVCFEPIKYPANVYFDRAHYAARLDQPDDPESWEVLLADLIAEAKTIRATEDKVRSELEAFLYSVRTYKQVAEKMPELVPHLPPVAGKVYPVTVPVAPLLATLTGLGFDKSAVAP